MTRIAIAPGSRTHDYEESLRRAGADPVVVDYTQRPEDVVRTFDGVLLAGGGDVLPSLYGEAAHASFDPSETGRDAYEIELARLAVEQDLPLLAICRGMQVLNVALGGTLIQDIPTEASSPMNHDVRETRVTIAHEAWMAAGGLLERLMRERIEEGDVVPVNSRHHQAVKEVAPGLVAAATAPDGVIEAVEHPGRRFCLGVQWHPENFYRTGEFSPIFEGFVRAARRR